MTSFLLDVIWPALIDYYKRRQVKREAERRYQMYMQNMRSAQYEAFTAHRPQRATSAREEYNLRRSLPPVECDDYAKKL